MSCPMWHVSCDQKIQKKYQSETNFKYQYSILVLFNQKSPCKQEPVIPVRDRLTDITTYRRGGESDCYTRKPYNLKTPPAMRIFASLAQDRVGSVQLELTIQGPIIHFSRETEMSRQDSGQWLTLDTHHKSGNLPEKNVVKLNTMYIQLLLHAFKVKFINLLCLELIPTYILIDITISQIVLVNISL